MKVKKVSMIMGIVLVIGVVGSLFTYQVGGAATLIEEERTFDASEITSLDIRTGTESSRYFTFGIFNDIDSSENIKVFPIEGDEIKVFVEGDIYRSDQTTFTAEVNDSTLQVNLKTKQVGWVRFGRAGSATLNIYLPRQQYESITINSSVGEISVEDLAANKVQITASIGDIKLNNIISEQTIITSDIGDIKLNNTISDKTTITNEVGSTDVFNLMGDLDARSSMGEVKFVGETIEQNIEIQNEIGTIRIEVARAPENATIVASNQLGETRLFGEKTPYRVFGDGENTVNLSSQMGEITVRTR